MAIENWFAYRSSDSVEMQRMAFYYRDGNNQRTAAVTGGIARTLACYVLCRVALARGYTIHDCTADFDSMRSHMDVDMYRSRMMEQIDLILDSILANPAVMIGTEAGGWGSNHCDVTVGDYSESDTTCAFAIRTRTNDFVRLGSNYSVDLIAACSILNALSPQKSILFGRTSGTGDYVFPRLSYTPGHYQHSDGKADWLARAGKIGFMYHSEVNYGGGYEVFNDSIAPLVWELRSNPLATSALRAINRVYYLVDQLRSEVSVATSNIHGYIDDATSAVDPSTIARTSSLGSLATSTQVDAVAQAVAGCVTPSDLSPIATAIASCTTPADLADLAKTSDLSGLATSSQADAIAQAVDGCAKPSDLAGLAKEVVSGRRIARSDDFANLATSAQITDLAIAIGNCAQQSDVSDLAKTSDLDLLATSAELHDLPSRTDIGRIEKKVDDLKPDPISSAVAFGTSAIGLVADLKSLTSGGARDAGLSGGAGGSVRQMSDRAQSPVTSDANSAISWTVEDEI